MTKNVETATTTEENKLCVGLAKEIYEETNKERISAGNANNSKINSFFMVLYLLLSILKLYNVKILHQNFKKEISY